MSCFVALMSSNAAATGFDLYGLTSRGTALGNAMVSSADDFSAVYYNPAGMVMGPPSVGGGFHLSFNNVGIRLAPLPSGYDVPDLGPSGPAVGTNHLLRERDDVFALPPTMGVFFGATTDFGFEDLRLGMAFFLPVAAATSQQSAFNDEREQFFSNQLHFDLIGGRVNHMVILFSAAYRVLDWVSLGVGVSFMPAAITNNSVYVPNIADQSHVDLNVDLDLASRWRPNFGVLLIPAEDIRVGVAFRDEQGLEVGGHIETQVRGLQGTDDYPISQDFDLMMQYSPRQFVWGVSWSLDNLLLCSDITYIMWADYPNHHNEDAGFYNVWVPRLGAELAVDEDHTVRLGLAFEPTPVSEQSGRTNYVDNDRLIGSVGMGHVFELDISTFQLSWHFQFHYLVPREFIKEALADHPTCAPGVTALCDEIDDGAIDPSTGQPWPEAAGLQTNNPGFPGYASGGWVANVGVDVTWEF